MKRLKVLGLAAAVAGGLMTAAQAAPLSPAPLRGTGDSTVEKVGYFCGPGYRLNQFGVCRPAFGPRPFYRPYGYYRPRPYYRSYGYRRPFF